MTTEQRFGRFALDDGSVVYARIHGTKLFLLETAPWIDTHETGCVLALSSARRLSPIWPSKIVCIGRNYREHAKEMGAEVPKSPLLFLKPTSSLLACGGTVKLPPESQRVEHEAELGVIIGRTARRVREEEALRYVFGYIAVADITARDLQRSDGQWTRGKGFDTFCPVGPDIVSGIDPRDLRIVARVNGEIRQQGNTKDMIFGVAQLVSYISQCMTLQPGDLIATGTPEGVGPLEDGDALEVQIDRLSTLRVGVAKEVV